jgi:hypothetical protein
MKTIGNKELTIEIVQLPNDLIEYLNVLLKNIFDNDRSCFEEGVKISFVYEIINGVIQPFDENTHYGNTILTNEETHHLVNGFLECHIIGDNSGGFITVNDMEGTITFS